MMRLGIAGLGTVGAEVARQIISHHHGKARLVAVCARDKYKDRGLDLSDKVQWFDDPVDMIEQCDIIVELMGGTGANVDALIRGGLDANKKVVTANKAYIADNLELLKNENIGYEAAVAGGIPIVETLKSALAGNQIAKITGILNGTCNYILSELETNPQPFDAIVRQAQDAGYAEADPTLDISGQDVLQKSMMLARLAFGDCEIKYNLSGLGDDTPTQVEQAIEHGQVIRLVSEIERRKNYVQIDIALRAFDESHNFTHVTGAQNAILIEGEPMKSLFLKGYGAGAGPTASAVLSDILKFSRGC